MAVLYLATEAMTAALNLSFCLTVPETSKLLEVLLIAERRLFVTETKGISQEIQADHIGDKDD